MRILGIDPGYAIVGYGAVECHAGRYRPVSYGVITTEAEAPFPCRLETIYRDLMEILAFLKPEAVRWKSCSSIVIKKQRSVWQRRAG